MNLNLSQDSLMVIMSGGFCRLFMALPAETLPFQAGATVVGTATSDAGAEASYNKMVKFLTGRKCLKRYEIVDV